MLRIHWTAAGGPVTGYKVQYVPLTGLGQPITAERQEVSAFQIAVRFEVMIILF